MQGSFVCANNHTQHITPDFLVFALLAKPDWMPPPHEALGCTQSHVFIMSCNHEQQVKGRMLTRFAHKPRMPVCAAQKEHQY